MQDGSSINDRASLVGGHTAEMLMLVDKLDRTYYRPRVYVVAETDKMSSNKALRREQDWANGIVGDALATDKALHAAAEPSDPTTALVVTDQFASQAIVAVPDGFSALLSTSDRSSALSKNPLHIPFLA